jgi:surface antigen
MSMKSAIAVFLAAGVAFGAAGCSQTTGPNESGGTILGAIAGGMIGSQVGKGSGNTAAIIAGTMLGGMVGSSIGRGLDEEARRQASGAQSLALSSGRQTKWQAPSGSYGFVEPGPVYAENSRTCRSYTHKIYINGKPETGTGTACKASDGAWDIVN